MCLGSACRAAIERLVGRRVGEWVGGMAGKWPAPRTGGISLMVEQNRAKRFHILQSAPECATGSLFPVGVVRGSAVHFSFCFCLLLKAIKSPVNR